MRDELLERAKLLRSHRRSRRPVQDSRGSDSRRLRLPDQSTALCHSDPLSEQHAHLPGGVAGPAKHAAPRLSNLFQSRINILMRRSPSLVLFAALSMTGAACLAEA